MIFGFTRSGFGTAKTRFFSFSDFIFPYTSPIIWLLRSCHLYRELFFWYNHLTLPLHVALCWDIGGTTCYQELPLVTCWMESWRRISRTRAFSLLWLMRKRLLLVAGSICHILVTLYLPSLTLFQNVTVDGFDVDLTQWNNGWIILFWSSCRQAY